MAKQDDRDGHDATWRDFKDAGQHKDGGESVGHESGRRIVGILTSKRAGLSDADYAHMRKVTGYVHRHLAQRPKKLLPRPRERRSADAAELAVEITSRSNANHDRVEKLQGYAAAAVPSYLLLDPWHAGKPTATLYGEPKAGAYRVLATVKYGDQLRLPAPFDVTIDTSLFPVG